MPLATLVLTTAIASNAFLATSTAAVEPAFAFTADLTLQEPAATTPVGFTLPDSTLVETAALAVRYDPGLQDDETARVVGDRLPAPKPYGSAGTKYWHLDAGAASDFATNENEFIRLGIGWGYFIADGLSMELNLNGLLVYQKGDDAVGLNVDMVLRWHFVRERTWSLYAEAGFGVMGSNDKVPHLGSAFNFTPQAGGGYSVELTEGVRLMLGVRWFHISNARTFERNPGRDSVYTYVAFSFSY